MPTGKLGVIPHHWDSTNGEFICLPLDNQVPCRASRRLATRQPQNRPMCRNAITYSPQSQLKQTSAAKCDALPQKSRENYSPLMGPKHGLLVNRTQCMRPRKWQVSLGCPSHTEQGSPQTNTHRWRLTSLNAHRTKEWSGSPISHTPPSIRSHGFRKSQSKLTATLDM